ncbi:GNAT family N-acetyltransferase [Salinicoccus albus]|uniref:GNAT family N-acetyltransferase n=1 Tax=Salinicoccus albus TaxID=418756 RepID=UPI00037D6803|nr:GNAT family N-acetyltransferase [Salinicoccus albus]
MKKPNLIRLDAEEDIEVFYRSVMKNTDYFTDYQKALPTLDEVKQEFFHDIPPYVYLENKEVYGIYIDRKISGFVDLLYRYPDQDTCMIGYLVIDWDQRRTGVGQKVYDEVREYMKRRNIKKIRVGVLEDNVPAVSFWIKQGFQEVEQIDTEYGTQITMEYEL